nr:uncharacterized protein LOC113719420 [Coffea arabica]
MPREFFDVDVVTSHTTRVDHVKEQKDNTGESLCEKTRVPTSNEEGRVPIGNEETLKELGIPVDELFNSQLMIQGFNQGGQRVLGSLNLEIVIDDMSFRALLYVIDAKTTYNVLLGRPWIHENGVVPSTLHQCFKYCQNGVARSVKADDNPFTEAGCGIELRVREHTVVYTRPKEDDEESIASCNHITLIDGDSPEEEEDVEDAPLELEEGVKVTVDDLKEINLGTSEDPRPIYISALLNLDEEKAYIERFREYQDIFAWTYKEMPGLDPKVAVHHLVVKKRVRPVKQAQRRFRSDLIPLIEIEVNKLIESGFIREVKYPTCILSIVPVRKKNGQIRICVDFRDLNNTCPKDDFSLPITELLIDATTGHEVLSFMDNSSGYNQILLAPEDEELTAFCTHKGIYYYKVMSFGLKNVGSTYQRAMQSIFDDILHKNIECYVDDLVVKSKKRSNHLEDLR